MLMNERAVDDSRKKGSICACVCYRVACLYALKVCVKFTCVAHLHFVCILCVSVYKTVAVCVRDSQNLHLVLAHTADQGAKAKSFHRDQS